MRYFLPSLLFIASMAQAASDVSVQSIEFQGKNGSGTVVEAGTIKMPFVQLPDQNIAGKINDLLFVAQFGSLAPRKYTKYLRMDEGMDTAGMASQSFSVSRNDGRILTIGFDSEGCGAYCETSHTFYSFDIKTGRALVADDLFTVAGMRGLVVRMGAEQETRYRQQLVALTRDLKAAQKSHDKASQESIQDLKDRIEFNKGCLGEGEGQETPSSSPTADMAPTFRYYQFELSDKALKLTAGRCSNHAMHALDDVGDVTLTIPYKEARPYLTSYGSALLFNEAPGAFRSSVYGHLLHGQMGGKIGITMLLHNESDNSVGGVYFYDKYRKAIQLDGRENGNVIELSEHAAEGGEEKATMRLTLSGDRLLGQWKGAKEFNVDLAP